MVNASGSFLPVCVALTGFQLFRFAIAGRCDLFRKDGELRSRRMVLTCSLAVFVVAASFAVRVWSVSMDLLGDPALT